MKPLKPEHHRLTHADALEADRLYYDTTDDLPERVWQALVWTITGIPTVPYGECGGKAFLALEPNGRKDTVCYQSVSRIARHDGPWVAAIGTERMRVLVLRHADLRQRECGLAALKLLAADSSHGGGNPSRALQQVRQIAQRSRMPVAANVAEQVDMSAELAGVAARMRSKGE